MPAEPPTPGRDALADRWRAARRPTPAPPRITPADHDALADASAREHRGTMAAMAITFLAVAASSVYLRVAGAVPRLGVGLMLGALAFRAWAEYRSLRRLRRLDIGAAATTYVAAVAAFLDARARIHGTVTALAVAAYTLGTALALYPLWAALDGLTAWLLPLSYLVGAAIVVAFARIGYRREAAALARLREITAQLTDYDTPTR